MSDKAPMTRRGIYLTNLQWADAKAAGDGNYSGGVRRRMDEWAELQAEKVERALDVDELTCEIDKLRAEYEAASARLLAARACEVIDLELQVEQLEAVPTYRVRWFVFGLTATLVASAVALAVLEGDRQGLVVMDAMNIERIEAENHLQNICNAGRALALTAGRVGDLRADVAYLLQRAAAAGHYKYDPRRDFGASSNALINYAYTGLEPTVWPSDRSDYAACVRAVRNMPMASADAAGAGDAWEGER